MKNFCVIFLISTLSFGSSHSVSSWSSKSSVLNSLNSEQIAELFLIDLKEILQEIDFSDDLLSSLRTDPTCIGRVLQLLGNVFLNEPLPEGIFTNKR